MSEILMINKYWNLIGREPYLSLTWELDFSQACSLCRMFMNHKNFDFTQISDKTNDMIFLKSPKTMFLGHFCPIGIFSKKSRCHTEIYKAPNIKLSFREKLTSQSKDNLQADGRRDRQTLFYRTLPAQGRDPTASLQQVTGGSTPNLTLKIMQDIF